jgi:hypothetical protein
MVHKTEMLKAGICQHYGNVSDIYAVCYMRYPFCI